jgi:hypothetical protein
MDIINLWSVLGLILLIIGAVLYGAVYKAEDKKKNVAAKNKWAMYVAIPMLLLGVLIFGYGVIIYRP